VSLRKPYLDDLDPDATRVKIVMDWMGHLGETFGADGAREALRYYERRGWISSAAREQLGGYLRGISLADPSANRPGGRLPMARPRPFPLNPSARTLARWNT
jgi:archaellum component FlaD/FlaE